MGFRFVEAIEMGTMVPRSSCTHRPKRDRRGSALACCDYRDGRDGFGKALQCTVEATMDVLCCKAVLLRLTRL